MDSQRRHTSQRPIEVDKTLLQRTRGRIADNASTRKGEFSIKPSVPQASAVGLHSQFNETFFNTLRIGLQSETGTVGVSTDNAETLARFVGTTHGNGEERSVVFCHKNTIIWSQLPGLGLRQLAETAGSEDFSCRPDNCEKRVKGSM